MATLNVWSYSTTTQAHADIGRAPFGVRWIDSDKGDSTRPDYRSRLVVQETRASSTIPVGDVGAVFAATPPLECLRVICSLVMSSAPAAGLVLRVLDISRAHPHCEIKRLVYVRLPLEDPRSQEAGVCGVLNMVLYGTRDAGQNFELTTTETLTQAGIEQGIFTPCVYKWKEKKAFLFHHGDDFVVAASRASGDAVVEVLRTKFIVKDRGTLGPGHGDLKEVTILNRLIR